MPPRSPPAPARPLALAAAALLYMAVATMAPSPLHGNGLNQLLHPASGLALALLLMGGPHMAASVLVVVRHGDVQSALGPLLEIPTSSWVALIYLGLFASVGVVTLQAWGQQRVDAMRSAIIYGLEPVFAATMGWFLIGESLGMNGLMGAALIVGALIVSQLQPPKDGRAAA